MGEAEKFERRPMSRRAFLYHGGSSFVSAMGDLLGAIPVINLLGDEVRTELEKLPQKDEAAGTNLGAGIKWQELQT